MTSKNTHIYYDNYSPDEHFHTEYENTTRDYGYNLQNKMESYDGKDQTATYAYDGTGTRIGKIVNGVSTGQIWNSGNVIAEYGTKGTKTYIRGTGGEIVKTKDSASNSRYFSYNAHGDTTNIIEKNSESTSLAVTAAYEYDAFGGLVTGTGGEADSNAFRYNGQYTDEETGLIYLRNRYYDPSIGRFTQEDTYWNPGNMIYGDQQFKDGEVKIPDYHAIVQSANLYVYCANEPLKLVDPSGNVAYETFYSLGEAIKDWAWNNIGYKRVTGCEKGSALYAWVDEQGNDCYSYTWCDVGSEGTCDPQRVQNDRPQGTTLVGYIHSHYRYNYLSDDDYDLASSAGTNIYAVYLKDSKVYVDTYRRNRFGVYREIKQVYSINNYKPWTYW